MLCVYCHHMIYLETSKTECKISTVCQSGPKYVLSEHFVNVGLHVANIRAKKQKKTDKNVDKPYC